MYYFLFVSQGNPSPQGVSRMRRHSIGEGGSPSPPARLGKAPPVPSHPTVKDLASSTCNIHLYIKTLILDGYS